MDSLSIAPCGVLCDLCIGFQRTKNKCVGCNHTGNKPYHCTVCKIKECPEKMGNQKLLCSECKKFPCKRIKNLDKRYKTKYGESPMQNLQSIINIGMEAFIRIENKNWKCKQCGELLCAHRDSCLNCGTRNNFFPMEG